MALALTLALGAGTLLSGCVSPPPGADPGGADFDAPAQVLAFGEPYETSEGQIFVLRIQDEYRPLLRRTGKLLDVPVSFLDSNDARVDLISSARRNGS